MLYGEADKYRNDKNNYTPDLLCYAGENNDVAIFQSGPLGGWTIVTGILIAEKSAYNDERCASGFNSQVAFSIGGLKLGDSEEKIYGVLGDLSFEEDDFSAYRHEHKGGSKISLNQDIYVTSGIEIGLDQSRIIWIRVYWQEST